ncbi:hypothetical protein B0O80DRAFT_298815 [Mortierella sp. GBAus27b]|nr:hypothetical protein B0O80DRAFT_298815 [Mortierella sp. GBAus27b]
MVHPEVPVVYRPTSKNQYLMYDVDKCARKLGLSRSQQTSLGIVCKRDYTGNITGYGIATNLALIKESHAAFDPEDIVRKYVNKVRVHVPSVNPNHFNNAKRVVVLGRQTQVPDEARIHQFASGLKDQSEELKARIQDARITRHNASEVARGRRRSHSRTREEDRPRRRQKRPFNRYRPIDNLDDEEAAPPTALPKPKWTRRYSIKYRNRALHAQNHPRHHARPRSFRWNQWRKPGVDDNKSESDDDKSGDDNQKTKKKKHRGWRRLTRVPVGQHNLVKAMTSENQAATLNVRHLTGTSTM